MRIPAGKLIMRLRLRTGDMQAVKFSDYELLAALNDARMMLWMALAERHSTIPRKRALLTMKHGAALLPDDYYTLVEISEGARIVGSQAVSDALSVELVYNAVPKEAKGEGESVCIPAALVIEAVEIAAAVVSGDVDAAARTAMSAAERVSQKREYARIPDLRPFS